MKPRSLKFVGALAATALLVTACGSSPEKGDGDSKIVITFLHTSNPDPQPWDAAVASFEKAHPNVTIKHQEVTLDDLNTQVVSRIGSGDTSIDVYAADEPRIPALAAKGLLADVSEYTAKTIEATGEGAVGAVSYDGKQYGFPQWSSTNLLFYNTDLLKKAGIALPSADPNKRLTYEELLPMAQKAQKAGAKYGFAFEQIDRYYQLQPVFESAGAGSGLAGDDMLTPTVATPNWVSAAKWYGDLFESGVSPRGIPVDQMGDQFGQGNIAFFVAGAWQLSTFEKGGVNFGVAPFPYFKDGKAVTPTDSWGIGVSPHSKHLDMAKEFAAYLTIDPVGSTEVYPIATPPQKLALEKLNAEFIAAGGWKKDLADITTFEISNTAVSRPRSIGYVDFETIMNKAFSDIRNGQDPQKVLAAADAELQTAFARLK